MTLSNMLNYISKNNSFIITMFQSNAVPIMTSLIEWCC